MDIMKFILTSLLLGVGLTMDAFSVSIANGLKEPNMKKGKMLGVASTYALFQYAMPMIGWICVHTIVEKFKKFEYAIPWIALILLLYIGGKMIIENIIEMKKAKNQEINEEESSQDTIKKLGFWALMVQGVATAIDALSVGFTIADYGIYKALICGAIIAVVTLLFCLFGLFFGKKLGSKFSSKAELIGGIILVAIGLEIFISGMIDLYA